MKQVSREILKGLAEIHELGYIYRDLKPSNIVITHEGKIKLCDYGLVTRHKIIDDSICGTPEYMAPERLNERRSKLPLDPSIDIWSFGILLYELLMGEVPFTLGKNIDKLVEKMYGGYTYISESYPSECRHLIFNILNTNPKKRFSLSKILEHSFYSLPEENPSGLFDLRAKCKCCKD